MIENNLWGVSVISTQKYVQSSCYVVTEELYGTIYTIPRHMEKRRIEDAYSKLGLVVDPLREGIVWNKEKVLRQSLPQKR
jgi:hypothetical protein